MTRRDAAFRLLGAGALAAGIACQSTAPAASEGSPCVGLTPPRLVSLRPVELPASFVAAHLSADLPAEVTVGPDGAVRQTAMRTTDLALLVPFAEETLKQGRFVGGTFEGNPATVRLPVLVTVGGSGRRDAARAPAELWIHVAAGQSREARWQLRDSISRVTVRAHVPPSKAAGAIVAVAPGGQTKTLVNVPASDSPQEIRQTVDSAKFFAPAGDYRVELRVGGPLASARFTVADDSHGAVINACETLPVDKKTGPGI